MTETPIEPRDDWQCALCETKPEFGGRAAFLAHCEASHPELFVAKPDGGQQIPASRTMNHHLDHREWFRSQWTYTLPDGRVLAYQLTLDPRDADDPMRF